ncbi:PAS domain S-box protein [Desulfovibrio ferrophilus]|uniref:histidine kinase n=1 Tax=Desulfovibrio ferrophilus TaxID=241368 RepID=A0A2Z6B016_9BACT|nr:PAS domain S-box protein [Desulfovibrio ferrophilus]BBD08849.1 signal transduction histidine kinase, nitrogen specific, NtrB [Desulfovibrio ferrophilus]
MRDQKQNRSTFGEQRQGQRPKSGSDDLRYRAVFAHMASALAIWVPSDDNTDFILRDMNPASERLNRIKREQVLGHTLSEILPNAESIGLPSAIHRALSTGETIHLPAQLYQDDKRSGWRKYTIFALPSGEIVTLIDDVTERKQAELKMRENLELFSHIFEDAFMTMLLIDPMTGNIVEANTKACEFYGYSRSKLKTLNISDINTLPTEELKHRLTQVHTQKQNLYNFKHRLASGEVREVEVHSGPVKILDQELLFSIIHDVTERKQANEALRQSEAALRSLIRSAPVGIGEVRDRIIGQVNDHLCSLTGYSPEELKGQSARILYPDEEEFLRVARIKHPQVQLTGHGSLETIFRCKDGERRNVILSSSWKDDQHQDTGMIFTALDITERKEAERELRKARRDLHNIIDAMPSAVFCVDLQGRIVLWNSDAARLACSDNLENRPLTSSVSGLSEFDAMLQETIRTREPISCKALPMERDGKLTFWDMLLYPLPEGGTDGAAVRLDEVTDRIHLEEIMIQSEKMLSLGGLAAGMAHEINNPLGGILQGAQNIIRRFDSTLPANVNAAEELGLSLEAMREYMSRRSIFNMLSGIRDSGERAAQIVANMLDFSRTSNSRRALVDITDCIEKTLDLAANDYDLKKKYDFRDIEIVRDFEELPPVPCTETEIQQVLLNLLVNAAHAMAPSSDHPAPKLILRIRRKSALAMISVEDNGTGIDPAHKNRIFEPFYTTKDPGEGTGLGLSVAYFIITRNHRGTISVDSAPGQGARFTITLPLKTDEFGT